MGAPPKVPPRSVEALRKAEILSAQAAANVCGFDRDLELRPGMIFDGLGPGEEFTIIDNRTEIEEAARCVNCNAPRRGLTRAQPCAYCGG